MAIYRPTVVHVPVPHHRAAATPPRTSLRFAIATACVCAASLPGVAAAQESPAATSNLGEIVVTAQRREQNIQDVGIAVTAMGG